MHARSSREWFLFIALLVALFLVFALWFSKERVEIPQQGGDNSQEDSADRDSSPPVGPHGVTDWANPLWPLNVTEAQRLPRIVDVTDDVHEPAEQVDNFTQDFDEGGDNFTQDFDEELKSIRTREEVCRRVFEEIYQAKFPKVRPDFLKNPHPRSTRDGKRPRNLELDGYNAELQIAFECNGQYHYKPGVFTKSPEDHKYQLWKDNFKKSVCRERGITLISIPYNVKKRDLRAYIEEKLPHFRAVVERLKKKGWNVPERPLQTPSYDGVREPSVHMGDTRSLTEGSEVTYSSSYIEGMD